MIMHTLTKVVLIGAATISLAACGYREPGRIEGGTVAGAGTGAVIGAIAGPPGIAAGAAIGAGAGALTSAATSPRTVNLGPPPWHSPH
jgi:hypothetical protein